MATKKKSKKTATKAKKRTVKKKSASIKKKPKLGINPLGSIDMDALSSTSGEVHGLDKDLASGIDSLIRDTSDDTELVHAQSDTVAETPQKSEKSVPDESDIPLEITEAIKATPDVVEDVIMPDRPKQDTVVDIALGKETDEPADDKDTVETESEPVTDEPAMETPAEAVTTADKSTDKPVSEQTEDKPAINEAIAAYRTLDDENEDMSKFFSFMLDEERFAISIDNVKEVLQFSKATPVPKTPPHMMGVQNLRGSVVPVVDLRIFLGISVSEVTVHTSIVIVETELEGEEGKIGAIIDSVSEVLEIKHSEITDIPKVDSGVNTDYIKGMGKVIGKKSGKEEFVMILSVENIFSVEALNLE